LILTAPIITVHADPQFDTALIIPNQSYTVGDPINIELTVTHPEGYQVIFPKFDQTWGDFTINAVNPPTKSNNNDGTETSIQTIDVRLFTPGTFTTPELSLSISDENGNLSELTAAPVSVTINSVLIEGDTQLRDIKQQAEIPYFNIWPWMISLIIFVLFIGGLAIIRNRIIQKKMKALVDNRTADAIAIDELLRIKSLKLPENRKYKEHYTLTSICIRRYLETIFKIPFLERATFEIQRSLKLQNVEPELIRKIVEFLEESDLVKFSNFKPDISNAYLFLESGRQIIELTIPDPDINDTEVPTNSRNFNSQNLEPSAQQIKEKMEVTA
jgi:glutaredoxin-related protein